MIQKGDEVYTELLNEMAAIIREAIKLALAEDGAQVEAEGEHLLNEDKRSSSIMERYYFTYGGEDAGHPYVGGWTVVEAPDRRTAIAAFRHFHPDRIKTLINCSGVYDEEIFPFSRTGPDGNRGARCHEVIQVSLQRFLKREEWDG